MRFLGKVIAVTGGGSGLGEAIVTRLGAEGAQVAVIDIDPQAAARVAGQVPGAKAFSADVSDPDAMQRVIGEVVAWGGKLYGAVNNAGVGGPFLPSADYPLDWWSRTIAINLPRPGCFRS